MNLGTFLGTITVGIILRLVGEKTRHPIGTTAPMGAPVDPTDVPSPTAPGAGAAEVGEV